MEFVLYFELPIFESSLFSRSIDHSADYLMSDVVITLSDGAATTTTRESLFRDLIASYDLFRLVDQPIRNAPFNGVADTYSLDPIAENELVGKLKSEFDLKVESAEGLTSDSPTGSKSHYSTNHSAEKLLGYRPTFSSWEELAPELQTTGFRRELAPARFP